MPIAPSLTIGIEEEYQTIDPDTYDLRSHVHTEILTQGRRVMQERIKAEMHQSVVEVGTGICRNINDAKRDLATLRRSVIGLPEVRIMYVWLDRLMPVLPLLRMGRGRMTGVDHNRNLEWIGASAALIAG